MKKALRVAFACIAGISFSSCLSTPVTPDGVAPEGVAPEGVAPVDAEQNAAAIDPTATPVASVAEELPLPADNRLTAETPPAELEERPQVSDTGIAPPSVEKILYFYPEPDPLYIAPASSVASTPEKTAPAKTAPAVAAPVKTAPVTTSAAKVTPQAQSTPTTPEKSTDDVLPGIWTAETATPATALESTTAKKTAEPSRSVQVSEGQNLEVWYPGSGWVYLGDASAQNGLEYQTRKLEKADTLFTFRAMKAGNYLLEFTRFDVLEDSFATDTLSVSVIVPESKKTGKVRAPDYRSATSAIRNDARDTQSVSSQGSSVAQSARMSSSDIIDEPVLVSGAANGDSVASTANNTALSPTELLEKAKKSLASGDPAAALASLETFFSLAVEAVDEGLFLKGQAYEANSPARDVRKALEAYETLVASWPESERWKDADARIRYIRQYYLGR